MTDATGGTVRWHPAIIERVVQQTARVTSVYLRSPLARSVAGQHLDVRLTAPDGYAAQRSYSIASAPGADLTELAIECLRDGEVSSYFHDVAQVGDDIDVRGPIGGHFVWRPGDGGPLLLIGGGSGVAPLMAIARERALSAPAVPALLLYSARSSGELLFRDELLGMDAGDPAFTLRLLITRGPRTRPADYERRIDRSIITDVLAAWGHQPARVYACGSNAFVTAATSALVDGGMAPQRIRTERFGGVA